MKKYQWNSSQLKRKSKRLDGFIIACAIILLAMLFVPAAVIPIPDMARVVVASVCAVAGFVLLITSMVIQHKDKKLKAK